MRWEYMSRNPAVLAGRNPKAPPRSIRVFTFEELDAISLEMSPMYAPLPMFAAATGLRTQEWQALQRKDIDRSGILRIRRTVSGSRLVALGKTSKSLREVPLSPRALQALDDLPLRLDSPFVFPAPSGALMDLDNFRAREWAPAVEASGVARPARIYDLRSTFASHALAAGVNIHDLAEVMGTSVAVIERHYGALVPGAMKSIARTLGDFEARLGEVPLAPSGRLGR